MIDEIIRLLNKAASPLEHIIYVSKWIKQAAGDMIIFAGHKFIFLEKKDVITELLRLPEYVEYQGVQFRFKLFNNQGEIRMVYEIDSIEDDSLHKNQIDKFGCWDNPITGHRASFMLLREGLENENDIFNAIEYFDNFIKQNNL